MEEEINTHDALLGAGILTEGLHILESQLTEAETELAKLVLAMVSAGLSRTKMPLASESILHDFMRHLASFARLQRLENAETRYALGARDDPPEMVILKHRFSLFELGKMAESILLKSRGGFSHRTFKSRA